MSEELRIGVVGATGAVGTVTLSLLAERGFGDVRAFASSRSAGKKVAFGDEELVVEQATPEALGAGELDLCFFSVGTDASRALVPPTVAGGVVAIDKSDAFRLADGIPLVVAGVNDHVLNGHEIVANPNCSAIQLSCVLKPLHDAAALTRVRLATYQSMSGAGGASMERLRATEAGETDLAMDWELEGDEFTEEAKLRAETRKILALPSLPIQATCIRVPVLVGHGQAIWVETEERLSPEEAREALAAAPHLRMDDFPTPGSAVGIDEVLVGRIRQDSSQEDGHGLALWSVNDNLRKGAALNAIQIAEALLERRLLPA
jgi:aspartate-semialdehyde dehydrogenase